MTEARVPKLHLDPETEQKAGESRADSNKRPLTGTPYTTARSFSSSDYGEECSKRKVSGGEPPSGVSKAMWEKFQALQSKRQVMTKASREKRVKELKQDLITKVKDNFSEEDMLILEDYNESVGKDLMTNPSKNTSTEVATSSKAKDEQSGSSGEWNSLKSYIDVNKHIAGIDKGRHAPKTKLEEKIDAAIAAGDITKAEELSDHLATREFGKKIADAFDAKKYSEQKQKEEVILKEKKTKKIGWRFDHKERWETKGNM